MNERQFLEGSAFIKAIIGKRADEKVYKTAAERIAAVRKMAEENLKTINELLDIPPS